MNDRIGISITFRTEDLEDKLPEVMLKVYEASKDGYKPCLMYTDDQYRWTGTGFTRLVIIFERVNEHKFSYAV